MEKYKKYINMLNQKANELMQQEIDEKSTTDTTYVSNDEETNEEMPIELIDNLKIFENVDTINHCSANNVGGTGNTGSINSGSISNTGIYINHKHPSVGGTTPTWTPHTITTATPPTWTSAPSVITTGTGIIFNPNKNEIKIKELENKINLLLKFMVMKGLIKDESEFSDFLDAVDVMDTLCDESEED